MPHNTPPSCSCERRNNNEELPLHVRRRDWVLRTIPVIPDDWIEEIATQERLAGRHPGRFDGKLAEAASACRAATQRGGGRTRVSVIGRWSDQKRFDLYRREIRELRHMIANE